MTPDPASGRPSPEQHARPGVVRRERWLLALTSALFCVLLVTELVAWIAHR